jgi:dihydrofolate synthase / folylpolyglutamate synthase
MLFPVDPVSGSNTAWLSSLSPWPERFGLERMQELLELLDHPERAFRSIHVVGTNGKTTTTKGIEALLVGEGVRTGATISPHVHGWAERISVDGAAADLERALARVRPAAESLQATQFEVITAAAFAEFAAAGVEVAAVEAGLGGRYDATNVIASEVVVLTNVALEHTRWLGSTREQIAREKLAVISPGAKVVLGEEEWESMAREAGAGSVSIVSQEELPRKAVELLLGQVAKAGTIEAKIPGRLEWRNERELWDGAHNPAGVVWLVGHLPIELASKRSTPPPGRARRRDTSSSVAPVSPPIRTLPASSSGIHRSHPVGGSSFRDEFDVRWTLVCSILADKDATSMLKALAPLGSKLVATSSSSPRALPAAELAALGESLFELVEAIDDPAQALARGRSLAAPDGHLLVTGSLYLLADLASIEEAVL